MPGLRQTPDAAATGEGQEESSQGPGQAEFRPGPVQPRAQLPPEGATRRVGGRFHAQQRVETLRLLFPWECGEEHHARLQAWAWTLGYSLLAGAERLFALSSRDFEVQFEGLRVQDGPEGSVLRQGILTFIDPNRGGSGYLERFAERLPDVATAALQHLDHDDCVTACYRCLKSYDNQRTHEFLQWPLVVSTLEGLREDTPVAMPLSEADVNDPRPWREAYDAGVGSPLEYRCLRLLEKEGLKPTKQFPISEAGGRVFTIADFAFPDRRLALYVDGASIHLGGVLRRDRRIEERLREMQPPWTVIRLGRRDIDGNPQATAERIVSALE